LIDTASACRCSFALGALKHADEIMSKVAAEAQFKLPWPSHGVLSRGAGRTEMGCDPFVSIMFNRWRIWLRRAGVAV